MAFWIATVRSIADGKYSIATGVRYTAEAPPTITTPADLIRLFSGRSTRRTTPPMMPAASRDRFTPSHVVGPPSGRLSAICHPYFLPKRDAIVLVIFSSV